ncbi:ABC transporter substrate-binding protein [Micromonospora carbonacea]|uniref:ABC transporter substrate-binding protein n=2 Tax=Micromonospora carbonacea TaxID=47853 RepID=UPI0037233628
MMITKFLRSRRPLAAAAALAVASASLTACGGSDSDDARSSGSATIRALLAAQPATLDPIVGARSAQIVWATMLEPLINTDKDLAPTDTGLVTSWTRTDATTWTFKVRPDVAFSNGEKADAAAVANTITLTRDAAASQLKSYFTNVTAIEAPDATTVVVKTKTPQYNIPDLLTTVYLVPPKYYQEKGSEGFAAAPVGTGPYVWGGANAGRDISVKKNPDYWGTKAANDGITFTWANEAAQRLALIQSKSVDISFDLPPAQASAAKNAGVDVVSTETAMKIIAFLDSTKAPFDDPKLREAAALAIDRDAIVKGIFDGQAVADAGLLNVKPGQQPARSVTADAARAKELVGSAAPAVQISYPAAQYTNIEEVAQAVGGSLEQSGFKVTYVPLDYGTLVKRIIGRQVPGISIFAGVPNVAVPDYFVSGFMKTKSITGNCPDPKIDELAQQALEQDGTEQAAPIYDQLNTIGVVDKHCYVPLYRQVFNYATAPGVSGVVFGPLNTVDFTKTTR